MLLILQAKSAFTLDKFNCIQFYSLEWIPFRQPFPEEKQIYQGRMQPDSYFFFRTTDGPEKNSQETRDLCGFKNFRIALRDEHCACWYLDSKPLFLLFSPLPLPAILASGAIYICPCWTCLLLYLPIDHKTTIVITIAQNLNLKLRAAGCQLYKRSALCILTNSFALTPNFSKC